MPLTGRYALQGAQMRIGAELWARRAGARLLVEDTNVPLQSDLRQIIAASAVRVEAHEPF